MAARGFSGAALTGDVDLVTSCCRKESISELAGFATLTDILRWRACDQPEQRTYTFLTDGETAEVSITNAELDARARAIATVLGERGLRGERVLLLYPPGLDLVTAVFGCLYAGAVAVLVYPPDPVRRARTLPRLLSIVADARPSALLTTSVSETNQRAFEEFAEVAALPRLTTDDVDINLSAMWRAPDLHKDDLALLQYTSGSTEEPRGVMLTHAGVLDNLRRIRSCFGITRESHAVAWLPPYHDMGLIGAIFETIYAAITITLMSPVAFLRRPARWLQVISRTGATFSGGPNFAYELCARKVTPDELAGVDLSSWQVAFNGAETVHPETLKLFADTFRPWGFRAEAYLPCYGLAEAGLIVSGGPLPASSLRRYITTLEANDTTGSPADRFVSCGRPIGAHRVVVVDPERRTPCAPGESGEIWVSGPSVAAGYWNHPEESVRTFQATLAGGDGPFLRTGDLGFLRDGELYVTSRLKDLIVVRGRNIHPQDVERTVDGSHPALRPDAGAAFGVDVAGTECLVVVRELRDDGSVPLAEVAEAISTAVTEAHDVRPYAVVLVKIRSIPKTASGKIQRGRTRDAFLAGTLRVLTELRDSIVPGPDVPIPPTPAREQSVGATPLGRRGIEDWLVAEIARLRGVDPDEIGIDEPFVGHGLDSASSIALVGDLEKLFGVMLPATLTWDYPSIALLAEHLAEVVTNPHRHRPPEEV